MIALDCLLSRNSVSLLQDPAPNEEDLANILSAAVRASDHRRLRPWRFLVIAGESRTRLGEIFTQAYNVDNPECTPKELEKLHKKCFRAPLIITVIASLKPDEKVPEIEQLLSAGGAAQLITVAAHALGYGSIWRTGGMAYNPLVHELLRLSQNESIIGFVYLGTVKAAKPLSKIDYRDYTSTLVTE